MILKGHGLTVRYPDAKAPALDRVDFELASGRLVAVAGPNGSGKTTLLRALLGAVRVESGHATLRGRPVSDWSPRMMAREIAVVPQWEEMTFPMRVRESVMLGRYAELGPLRAERPIDREVVADALHRCDALHLQDRLTHTLSAGERQRVRLARALAQTPRALVLDEPTSALDVRHEMEVFELIRHLVDDGLACLIVTHHLNVAARYADTVVLLDQGVVAASGPVSDVLREEVVSRVFEWPVTVTPVFGVPHMVPLRPGDVRTDPPAAS